MAFFRTGLFQNPRTRRASVMALLGLAAVFLGQASSARPPDGFDSRYSVTLEDQEGAPRRTFRKDGTTFALGYLGDRYEVRIENHTDRRVEAVLSVDGRDAISGEIGDFVHERGYVVPPYGSIRVDGFRRSLDNTAAFRFSSPSSSYSSRMGTPENVGVIGVAFFPERRVVRARPPYRPRRDEYRWDAPEPNADARSPAWGRSHGGATDSLGGAEKRSATAPAASTPAAPEAGKGRAEERTSASEARARDDGRDYYGRDDESAAPTRLGTEFGETTWSPVTEVSFVRQNASSPAVVSTLRYDDADGLIARGIDVYPRPYWPDPVARSPDPFPESRFAKPPPW